MALFNMIATMLLAAFVIGYIGYDLRSTFAPRQMVAVVLSDSMTLGAAQAVAAVMGWRLVQRGCEVYLVDARRTLRHQCVLVAA